MVKWKEIAILIKIARRDSNVDKIIATQMLEHGNQRTIVAINQKVSHVYRTFFYCVSSI